MSILSLCLALLLAASAAIAQNPQPPAPGTTPDQGAIMAGLAQAFGTNGMPDDMQQGMAAAAQMLKAMQGGSTNNPLAAVGGKPAVDFRELKALLPEELAGLHRTNAGGEKSGAFGVQVAMARGDYGSPDGPRLEVKITDLGAMGQLGAMAQFGWMATDIDREDDNGYERTATFRGAKGLEKYSAAQKSGSIKVMIGGRFLIEVEGDQVEPAQLMTAVEALDFDRLTRLANRPTVN
ncbi:MAG: hypothetical protein FGM15_04725 [Chthoniobacterales bacterium]|nr:hypothetical protein [Chthoniobacterales bacterium]